MCVCMAVNKSLCTSHRKDALEWDCKEAMGTLLSYTLAQKLLGHFCACCQACSHQETYHAYTHQGMPRSAEHAGG